RGAKYTLVKPICGLRISARPWLLEQWWAAHVHPSRKSAIPDLLCQGLPSPERASNCGLRHARLFPRLLF
ncbi:hypothetical protein FB639_000649, partial [Coemansia asiatica]